MSKGVSALFFNLFFSVTKNPHQPHPYPTPHPNAPTKRLISLIFKDSKIARRNSWVLPKSKKCLAAALVFRQRVMAIRYQFDRVPTCSGREHWLPVAGEEKSGRGRGIEAMMTRRRKGEERRRRRRWECRWKKRDRVWERKISKWERKTKYEDIERQESQYPLNMLQRMLRHCVTLVELRRTSRTISLEESCKGKNEIRWKEMAWVRARGRWNRG